MSEWNAPPPAGSQFKAPQHGLDALIHRLEQIELSVRNLANPPLLTTLLKTVSDLTAQQAALTAQDVQILDLIGKQVVIGSNARDFGMSASIVVGTSMVAPTTLITLSVVVPAGVTKAIATTSAVPSYSTTGAASTVITESELNVAGAFSYAANQVAVTNDAFPHPCTLTKSIVLAAVTPGATITMTVTAFGAVAGVRAEGDAALSVLFLR